MRQFRTWSTSFLAATLLLSGSFLPGAGTTLTANAKAHASENASQTNAGPSVVVLKSNGVITQQEGLFIDGQAWVPVTFLRDVLNLPLEYDAAHNIYSIGKGFRTVNLTVSSDWIGIDINGYYLRDMEGKLVNGHLFVPFKLVRDYLGYQGDWHPPTKRLNVMISKENKLNIETVTVHKESEEAVINLNYPQINNLGNPDAEKAINDVLKKKMLEYEAWIDEQLQNRSNGTEHPYEFESNYVVTYNAEGVLSLINQTYEYTGGAHGMTVREGYNFSLRDGQLLTLDDLFGANKDYKMKLNEQLTAKLQAIPEYFGGFTGVSKDTDFYVQAGKLNVFFQLYHYTPYSSGIPEFTIPFSDLLPKDVSPFDGR